MTSHIENARVQTPFTILQVASLNEFQHSSVMHPFTCEVCRAQLGTFFEVIDRDGDVTLRPVERGPGVLDVALGVGMRIAVINRLLVATTSGWFCPTCDYTQDWAWAWMANDLWRTWSDVHPRY